MDKRNGSKGIGTALGLAAFLLMAAVPDSTMAAAGGSSCKSPVHKKDRCSTPRGQNTAPTISGNPPAQAVTGQSYSFTPAASDPDGDPLTFSIANRPGWSSFSASTGRLSGTPPSTSAGEYIDIVISVSDGKATAELAPFSIVVSTGNHPPSISGTPSTSAREGQPWEFRPTATDADGDPLTFGITNRPSWASFNTSTGTLSGTPGSGTVGTYSNVSIRVSDGQSTATLPAFSIGVQQSSMGSATLSWQAPTQCSDGTPLTNLAGFRIRYGTVLGSYPNVVQIANPGVTTYVISNLPPGTYYFVATAYDANGSESDFSAVVSKTIV